MTHGSKAGGTRHNMIHSFHRKRASAISDFFLKFVIRVAVMASLQASLSPTFISSSPRLKPYVALVAHCSPQPAGPSPPAPGFCQVSALGSTIASSSSSNSRRSAIVLLAGAAAGALSNPPARADIEDDYKKETQKVIVQVRETLGLDKADPGRGEAVKALRQVSNDWVAKYRREKRFAGKPSYSNIYSVLNAVSGHFISYGDGSPLPAKRKAQILEEVDIAERALGRGR